MMKFFSQQFKKIRLIEVWVEHPVTAFEEVNDEGVGAENEKGASEEADDAVGEDSPIFFLIIFYFLLICTISLLVSFILKI